MSAIAKMIEFCRGTRSDFREYAEIIKADDPSSAERLGQLMIRLQKSIEDVKADKDILDRIRELRGLIGAARGIAARAKGAEAALASAAQNAFAEHQRIDETVRTSANYAASLWGTVTAGEEAIAELNKLREDNAELLRDEPAANPAELGC